VKLYTITLKYFHLAIAQFSPKLKALYDEADDRQIKEDIENLIEAYEDIDKKIVSYNLNYSDPDRKFDGEPDEIEINLSDGIISNTRL
jgi:hypothetical protein